LFRAKDQKDLLKYILTIKNKLSRPRVKYQVHFVFYMIFLCLLSYLVLFVKPSLLEINDDMTYIIQNDTCSQGGDAFCSKPKSSKQSWSFLQLLINTWVFMFALEEFRQVRKIKKNETSNEFCFYLKAKLFKTKDNGIGQTLMLYFDESWNKLDALCVVMYVASISLESCNTKTTLNAARFACFFLF
jgi:hypothetical protein